MNTAIASAALSAHCPTRRAKPKAAKNHRDCEQRKAHAAEVEAYMPLVYKLAGQVQRQVHGQADHDDLVSWGTTGLLESMKRFDASQGAKLSTFAYYRIRGAMLDGIGKVAPLSRKCYRNARNAGDMHAIYRKDCEAEDIIDPRDGVSPEDLTERQQLQSLLQEAIARLSAEQQHLVRQHYFSGETLKTAGQALGISKSWACRSHAKAINNLRIELQRSISLAA